MYTNTTVHSNEYKKRMNSSFCNSTKNNNVSYLDFHPIEGWVLSQNKINSETNIRKEALLTSPQLQGTFGNVMVTICYQCDCFPWKS